MKALIDALNIVYEEQEKLLGDVPGQLLSHSTWPRAARGSHDDFGHGTKAEPRRHERGYDDGADRNKHGRDCGKKSG